MQVPDTVPSDIHETKEKRHEGSDMNGGVAN